MKEFEDTDEFYEECLSSFYKEMFLLYAKNNNGKINFKQFYSLAPFMGIKMTKISLQNCFESVAQDNSGLVDFAQFMTIVERVNLRKYITDAATLHQRFKLRGIDLSYIIINRMISTKEKFVDRAEFSKIISKVKSYKEDFDEYDKNGDGIIDFSEMMMSINKYLGITDYNSIIYETRKRFDSVDLNKDGKVNFSEFVDMLELKQVDGSHSIEAFLAIDTNRNGFIERDELISYLERVGDRDAKSNSTKMISFVDKNLDGKVSYAEFDKIYNNI